MRPLTHLARVLAVTAVGCAVAACGNGAGREPPSVAGADEVSVTRVDVTAPRPPASTTSITRTTPSGTGSQSVSPLPVALRVPAGYPTIQDAVDVAGEGDTVLIAPGVYAESVVISKPLTLTSELTTSGDSSVVAETVIDGGGAAFVVSVVPDGAGTIIHGVTLRNAEDGVTAAGSFDFRDGRIHDTGDGIDYEGGSGDPVVVGLVAGSRIDNNRDDAIDLDGATAVTIRDSTLVENGDDGIEVRLHDYTGSMLRIVIANNVISRNGEDGIQLIDDTDLSTREFWIVGNVVADNADAGLGMMPDMNTTEDFGGAGLGELVVVLNNTIVGNDHGVTGGDRLVMVNNIVAHNVNAGVKRAMSASVVAHSLFFDNGIDTENVSTFDDTLVYGDPLLDPGYGLGAGSPAIDAGIASFSWNGRVIVDWAPEDYAGGAPDLGAYESGHGGTATSRP